MKIQVEENKGEATRIRIEIELGQHRAEASEKRAQRGGMWSAIQALLEQGVDLKLLNELMFGSR